MIILWSSLSNAQDRLPKQADIARKWSAIQRTTDISQLMRQLSVGKAMPSVFRSTSANVLVDPKHTLDPIWAKLGSTSQITRIVHIGDSHIRGHVLAYEVRTLLEQDFGSRAVEPIPVSYQTSGLAIETAAPGPVYHILGINGATCSTFVTPEHLTQISDLHPDLIIFSFGTNEANVRNYDSVGHMAELSSLCDSLQAYCPTAKLLLTTPPGAYYKVSRRNRIPNPHTEAVVRTQLEFAHDRGLAYWDLYHIVGGQAMACRNWQSVGAYRSDLIHFTHEGYRLQGRLLREALVKAYNDYVATQLTHQ